MSDRCILAVKFSLAGAPKAVRKAVGGFLRYVQYRDKHVDSAPPTGTPAELEGMLKYVAHRDSAATRGRLFGPGGQAGDEARRALAAYVGRSVRESQPIWGRTAEGRRLDRRRAAYRFVISPETAAGLDLEALTDRAVAQLEADLQGPVRWIAAEHRNTQHPHVHLVVAGIRELPDGRLESWLLSRDRLAHMKEALALEIERQRRERLTEPLLPQTPVQDSAPPSPPLRPARPLPPREVRRPAVKPAQPRSAVLRPRHRLDSRLLFPRRGSVALRRLAARYRYDLQREVEDERRRREREPGR